MAYFLSLCFLQYRWPFNVEKSDLTKEQRVENQHDQDDGELLYVTLTYFNFAQSTRRKQLFLEFIDYLLVGDFDYAQHVRIIVIEAILTEEHKTNTSNAFELPDLVKNESSNLNGGLVYSHYKHELHTIFWCKENLINFASNLIA